MRTTYFDNSRFPLALIATALPLLLAACGGGGGGDNGQPTTPTTPTTPTGPQPVAIEFAAKAGNLPAKCGTPIAGVGTTQATVDLHDLRFYVSGVSLINDKGEAVAVTLDVNDWQTKK
ncbi:MbnP family protein [Delftia acidovorans]|uniref:MbnP family protein n=1 Tax=Delftia acidovorans TaxID=80866 RepID=UPI0003A48B75|nr:MbnP family protein [Delftia acidovorans]